MFVEWLRNLFRGLWQKQPAVPATVWFYKSDDHETWLPYVCLPNNDFGGIASEDIERQYAADPQSEVRFTSYGRSYVIDFQRMLQTNVATGKQRAMKRELPQPAAPAATAAAAAPADVQQGAAAPRDDAGTSRQVSEERDGRERRLRASAAAARPSHYTTWYFEDDTGEKWIPFVDGISADEIERRYAEDPCGRIRYTFNSNRYVIDLETMTQKNEVTGRQRGIRRDEP